MYTIVNGCWVCNFASRYCQIDTIILCVTLLLVNNTKYIMQLSNFIYFAVPVSERDHCLWESDHRHHRVHPSHDPSAWWRQQMETLFKLLAICAGNSPVTGKFPAQRPVTRSFDVFFDLRRNKRLSKYPRSIWFETPSCPLWRHCNIPSNAHNTNFCYDSHSNTTFNWCDSYVHINDT